MLSRPALRAVLVGLVTFAVALASLLFVARDACNTPAPPCVEPDASTSAAPAPAHRLGWAPPGAIQTNYTGLSTGTAVIKASPATLLSLYVVNRNAAARYLQLFDQTGAVYAGDGGAGSGEVPTYQFLVPAASAVTLPLLPGGQSLVNGLVFGVSTTNGTYTAATATDHDVEAVYQ